MSKVRNKFSDRVSVKMATPIELGKPGCSRVQQHFKDDCNPVKIINRHLKMNSVPQVRQTIARYGDFDPSIVSGDLFNKVAHAEQAFGQLPSSIRSEFNNDAAKMLKFMSDSKNFDRCVELGLFEKPKPVPKNEVLDTLKEVAANTKPKKTSKVPSDE